MNTYEEGFSFYLKYTKEKEILAKELISLFRKLKVNSVLDIGAGNGDLASLIFNQVKRYVAIEPRKKFVKSLKDKEINVIEDNFPCNIGNKKFDFILCSHSTPSLKKDYEPFLKVAFEKLNKNGNLLLITYLGGEDDWNTLLKEINIKPFENASARYLDRKNFVEQFGDLKEWFVNTKIESSSMENMIKALSFVASGGEEEKKNAFLSKSKEISEILNEKYYNKESNNYFFPFKHVFLMVNKK